MGDFMDNHRITCCKCCLKMVDFAHKMPWALANYGICYGKSDLSTWSKPTCTFIPVCIWIVIVGIIGITHWVCVRMDCHSWISYCRGVALTDASPAAKA
jgi:hypothetical protein